MAAKAFYFFSCQLLVNFIHCASAVVPESREAIAILTNGDSLTQLRIIRNSPKTLLSRSNHRRMSVGQDELIAFESLGSHKWSALAHDVRRQEYYLLDTAARQFLVCVDDPFRRNTTSVLLNGISPKVKALAYDWLRRQLYWGDPSLQAILRLDIGQDALCDLHSRHCTGSSSGSTSTSAGWKKRSGKKVRGNGEQPLVLVGTVIGTGLENPSGMAIDPIRRMLYWADDGTVASLHASSLNGHNRTGLLQSMVRPAGLTLDYRRNRLYWLERLSGLSVIRWCVLTNGVCIPVTSSEEVKSQLNALDYYEDFLIMSDTSHNRLIVFEESTDRLYRQHLKDEPQDVVMSSYSRQPGVGKPQVDVRLRTDMFENILEKGVIMMASEKRGILLVDRTFTIGDSPRNVHVLVPERGITTMAIDVIRQRLFYFVKDKKIIYRVNLPHTVTPSSEPPTTTVVSAWIDDVTGMAVDWATGNLYWLDNGYKRIMMARGTGHYPHVVHHRNVSSPRNLVIHSKYRYMFWSDSDAKQPRIERSNLDGDQRIVILSGNSFYERPYALALDVRRDSLYYSDGPFLCRCSLAGRILGDCKRRDLAMKAAVKVIDIMHDYILWTDFIGGLASADIDVDFPLDHTRRLKHFPDMYLGDVKYFHLSRQPAVDDPCRRNYPFSRITLYGRQDTKKMNNNNNNNNISINHDTNNNIVNNELMEQNLNLGQKTVCSHLCVPSLRGHVCRCEVGYWLKHDGSCDTGVLSDRFLIMGDLKTKRLFRQFVLLPDYYVIKTDGYVHSFHLAVDEQDEQIYWLDEEKNMIFCSDFDGKNRAVVYASIDFNMTQIVVESRHRLLYIVTSSGHVIVLSLTSGRYVYIIKDANLSVMALATDVINRRLFMSAVRMTPKPVSGGQGRVRMESETVILSMDMEGLNSRDLYLSQGKPSSLTLYNRELFWIDKESKAIYSYPIEDTSSSLPSSSSSSSSSSLPSSSSSSSSSSLDKEQQHTSASASSWNQKPTSDASNSPPSLPDSYYRMRKKYRKRLKAIESNVKERRANNNQDSELKPLVIVNDMKKRKRRDVEGKLEGKNSTVVDEVSDEDDGDEDDGGVGIGVGGDVDSGDGGGGLKLRTVCRLSASSNPRDMVITPDGDIFFSDGNVRNLLRTHTDGNQITTDAGFPYLNRIRGLAYFDTRNKLERLPAASTSCKGIVLPRTNGKDSCVCDVMDHVPRCRDRRQVLETVAKKEGLCIIPEISNAEVKGQKVGTYVMPGQRIEVSCRPGYLLSTSRLQGETRMCQGERWNSTAICHKAYGYHVTGNDRRGYVIFNKSMTFIVPVDVQRVDVICIGGGGGGFDPCTGPFNGQRRRAGIGGVSKFGRHLRAHGGQGGAKSEGGRGGRGRNLFGGEGKLNADCQGGGAAGETREASVCRLSSTSCPFCGSGGALRKCNRCPRRRGGCSGPFSQSQGVGAADNFGGGASGESGGGGGGGGGFSRKSVRVIPLSKIPVIVGRPGIPTANPAGSGVVVVSWGGVIEDFLEASEIGPSSMCKPYTLTNDLKAGCK